MGILDDAIREHLELKRQHGAAGSDISRLENEAFGAATRPGDPGDETGESPLPPADRGAGESEDEAPTTVAPISDDPAAEPQGEDDPASPSAEPVEAPEAEIFDAQGGELDVGNMSTEDFAAAAGGRSESTPAERARREHSELDDTIDHPGPEPESLSAELEQAAPTEEDRAGETEGERRDETEGERGDETSDASEPAQSPVDQEGEDDEAAESGDEGASEDAEGPEGEDDADLLEETPEFLKEAPEGEDLWFEQGPPKDFDFN